MMRLFIALPLPKSVEEYLAKLIADLRAKGGSVKWVDAHLIHLTLRFLGDTEEALVPKLQRAIDDLAAHHLIVRSNIDRLGVFPNIKRPNVIWVGLHRNADLLAEMNVDIEKSVREFGFEPDNKMFKVHLTLGRVKDQHNLTPLTDYLQSYRITPVAVDFDRVILFRSTLTPQGPIYQSLHQAQLQPLP
ncbi:MAG: RNA 2',3'-cyclic phosphodiesterase [Candidatus Zixiibacteriota bacterium]